MTDNPNRILGDSSGNQVDTIDDGGIRRLAVDMKMSLDLEWALLQAGRNTSITDSYLRGTNGVPTNLAGFVLPFDAKIIGIGAATDGTFTWTAEVRKNGAATVIASLSLTAVAKDYRDDLSVNTVAGDEIQVYCNGTSILRPQVIVALSRR